MLSIALFIVVIGLVAAGMKPGAEVQYRLSDGVRTLALKISWPTATFVKYWTTGPLCVLRRSDTSARAIDLRAGDSRLLIGTQCDE